MNRTPYGADIATPGVLVPLTPTAAHLELALGALALLALVGGIAWWQGRRRERALDRLDGRTVRQRTTLNRGRFA